jgi:signal transduction histidine kinase
MGGNVAVESQPGRGSRFVVELPREGVESPTEPATAADAA